MDQFLAAMEGAWRVLVTCLILGAGLPTLYVVGIRQLALADTSASTPSRSAVPGVHRAVAYVLFAVVVVVILLGLAFIMAGGFGYSITFDGVPALKKK